MNLQKVLEKKVLIISAGILVLFLVILLAFLTKKQVLEQQIQTQQGGGQDQGLPPSTIASPLPQTVVSAFTLGADLPTLPESVKLSDLKTSYTTGEALDMATKIGLANSIVDDGVGMILVRDQTGDQETLLTVSKESGNFLFVSERGYPSGVGGADAKVAARAFLTKMGIMDDTIDAYATYKRASSPGITFVEFHRSWEKLGLPIINPLGVLNLTETERLADVKLGYIENAAPDDPDVIESSDGKPGKIRPNQFNTITVGVSEENNNVMNVSSNLKLFTKTQQKSSTQTLKTPEEALEEIRSGRTSFSMAKPTGEGVIELQNVFPGNRVELQDAVINEVMLTYLDDLGQQAQSTLYPYYLFRGTATSSGYQVQFVQTVAAVKQIYTLGAFAQNSRITIFPGQGNTLQYGTFNWLSPAPNPDQNLACAGLTQLFQLPNGGYIGWYPNVPERTWYYVPPPGEVLDATKFQEIKTITRWEAAKACKASKLDPTICAYTDIAIGNLQTACYFLGAGSPFIFVYTKTPKDMIINLPKSVTYADPALSQESQWSFTTSPDQPLTFSSGLTRQKLYYEYNKNLFKSTVSSLKKSNQGYKVDKDSLGEFTKLVSEKLGLTSEEKNSLLIELTREANKVSGRTLKVGVLDRKTLDSVLPVTIVPQPQTYHRVFFTVSAAAADEQLESPTILTLTRDGDVVVELGALGY